ncbi:hypothetical protein [Marinobacter mobilis]|uniref:Multidrug transporter n=1 Tax=Marinobacter mobilis TaxID=488533 RepID=A0A1H3DQS2_9GAMM|nr:hypothetical protein [Marinobacter mobilis]SDX68009.1 hypothetical protein SAMN04487960_11332 [Marinobacter mobilis]
MPATLSRILTTTVAVCMLAFASAGHANTINDAPSALEMTADAVIARPLLLATTVVGTAVYIVSLPFSLLGGNAGEAGEVLVLGPAKSTFLRCLGCDSSGRRQGGPANESN